MCVCNVMIATQRVFTLVLLLTMDDDQSKHVILNPRCTCAVRVTVIGLCVCVCVCVHFILLPRANYRTTRRTSRSAGHGQFGVFSKTFCFEVISTF